MDTNSLVVVVSVISLLLMDNINNIKLTIKGLIDAII